MSAPLPPAVFYWLRERREALLNQDGGLRGGCAAVRRCEKVMAGVGGGGDPREPPRNLQGLLEMAVAATGPQTEPREPMGEEVRVGLVGGRGSGAALRPAGPPALRPLFCLPLSQRQRWLRAAVAEALGGTGQEVEELRRCLEVLARPCPGEEAAERGPGETASHERALEVLAELCESLDNATGGAYGVRAVLGRLGCVRCEVGALGGPGVTGRGLEGCCGDCGAWVAGLGDPGDVLGTVLGVCSLLSSGWYRVVPLNSSLLP